MNWIRLIWGTIIGRYGAIFFDFNDPPIQGDSITVGNMTAVFENQKAMNNGLIGDIAEFTTDEVKK